MSTILVVAPHPDDETLGCGGALLRHKAEGDDINWLIMSTITEDAGYSAKRVSSRKKEIDRVAKAYDFSHVSQLNYITARLDTVAKEDMVKQVSNIISNIKPDTIYIPFRGDAHSDHKIVFDVVASCTKSFRYPFLSCVRAYETLSETEFSLRTDNYGFNPNYWVGINEYLEKKISIMKMFQGEMGEHPFPRSELNIKALATLRGATAGVLAAEAFMILKEIRK